MARDQPERDWKYFRDLKPELLATLTGRINREAAEIIADATLTQHERYLKLYKHINDSDRIVAVCFNAWSRSSLMDRVRRLINFDLLTDEQIAPLSDEIRERIARMKSMRDED